MKATRKAEEPKPEKLLLIPKPNLRQSSARIPQIMDRQSRSKFHSSGMKCVALERRLDEKGRRKIAKSEELAWPIP